MSSISGVSSAGAIAQPESKKDADQATLDYDSFLQLLVAQMQNQDPLNPTDATEQLAQLASFSNVEQSIKVNQKLESMLTLNGLSQADAVLGRTVTSGDGTVTGVVKSVNITDEGAIATLVSGKTISLGAGIKVE
ncbi:MAG: flagellar hook assembly protein FlgD [Rhizobiaceae bacterium]|nr:flagellar hook assembly protein FlgD [Rhizobiaceae bacterium]